MDEYKICYFNGFCFIFIIFFWFVICFGFVMNVILCYDIVMFCGFREINGES